jgi:hypothetical protein
MKLAKSRERRSAKPSPHTITRDEQSTGLLASKEASYSSGL